MDYNCVVDLLETPEKESEAQNLGWHLCKRNRQKKFGILLPKEVVVFQH